MTKVFRFFKIASLILPKIRTLSSLWCGGQALILFSLLPLNIVINEIAWMGTVNSANDEWIELYNNTPSPINLEGWMLKAADGTPKIQLASIIAANDFYLLARTKDYTGALNNKGEKLELYDDLGNLIDSVDASLGWPAGDNATKQTMERKDAGGWKTSQNSGGTPGAQNSKIAENSSPPAEVEMTEAEPQSTSLLRTSKTEPQTTETEPQMTEVRPQSNSELAAVGQQTTQKSPLLLLVAGTLAIFSGIIILVLKRGLKY